MKWFKTPKGYMATAMILCLAISSIALRDAKGLVSCSVAVGAAVFTDLIFFLFKQKKQLMPDGAIITGLIVSLVLSTSTPWWVVAATSFLSILSKHLLVYKKKPLFNPAVVGLFLSVFLFQTGQSWWGSFADLPVWMLILLVLGGYVIVGRVNKFPQVFTFLGVYLFLLYLLGVYHLGDAADALRPPFINAALFFAFFMLTDPPTSPAKTGDQLVFGVLTAFAAAEVYAIFGGLTYLFVGLLVGNLYYYFRRHYLSGVVPI